jgi:hypothetical protein
VSGWCQGAAKWHRPCCMAAPCIGSHAGPCRTISMSVLPWVPLHVMHVHAYSSVAQHTVVCWAPLYV